MEIDLLSYLVSKDFINLKKVRKFIDNKFLDKFLDFNINTENNKIENYKFCNHKFTKGKFKGTYCFAKTFNHYTDKCKIHNKDYKSYKENNLQSMNQFIDGISKYYDFVNSKEVSNEDIHNNNIDESKNKLKLIIDNIPDSSSILLPKPSAPKLDEIIEIVNSPPVYEQKPDETGKSIINEINNSIDIQKSLFNNEIIKISGMRKSKKKKNKNKNKQVNNINTNEIINIKNYFNKLDRNLKTYENKNIYKDMDEFDAIIEFNKDLIQNKEISEFINKYQFLSPIVNNGLHILISNLSSYEDNLNKTDLSQYPDFKGFKVYNLSKNIIDYQLKIYYLHKFNNTNLSNKFINLINNFISRIPK